MFDIVMESNEWVETLVASESISKQRAGLYCHAAAGLYQTTSTTTSKWEVTFKSSVNHEY